VGIGIAPKVFVPKNLYLGAIGNWELGIGIYAKVGSEAASLRNDWELGSTQKLVAKLLPYVTIGNWELGIGLSAKVFLEKLWQRIVNWDCRLKDVQA
jgi:hypothetical protein